MNSSKQWDGVSQLGETFIRQLDRNGRWVGTVMGNEVNSDGSLGTVLAKHCLEYNATYRSGGGGTGLPFLSTWQAPQVSIVDATLPFSARNFTVDSIAGTYPFFISNSVFVGDGFMLGAMATSNTQAAPTTVAPVLMRLPSAATAETAATFLAADPVSQKKMSVLLQTFNITALNEVYVIATGWMDATRRYGFAVVSTEQIVLSSAYGVSIAAPRLFVGNTGTMTMVEVPLGLGMDWTYDWNTQGNATITSNPGANYLAKAGRVTCTAPGRLEMIVFKPESDKVTTHLSAGAGAGVAFPVTYGYLGMLLDTTAVAGFILAAPPGWGGNWESSTSGLFPGFNYHYDTTLMTFVWQDQPWIAQSNPRNANHTLYATTSYLEYPSRRDSFFLAQSTDFGLTWTLTAAPTFAAGTYQSVPQIGGYLGGTGANDFTTFFPSGTAYAIPVWAPYSTIQTRSQVITQTYDYGTLIYYDNQFIPYFVYPTNTIAYPDGLGYSNRGPLLRPLRDSFQLIGAGATTFALVTGIAQGASGVTSYTADGDFFDLLMSNVDYSSGSPKARLTTRPLHPTQAPTNFTAGFGAPQMYVRTNGSFIPISWPGDTLFLGTADDNTLVPSAAPHEQFQERRPSYPPLPVDLCWCSTGEGCAAFFMVQLKYTPAVDSAHVGTIDDSATNNTVTVVATLDGGAHWATLVLSDVNNMRSFCLIRPELGDKGVCIVYAANTANPNLQQLMRISSDFTKVTKYGAPFPPQRGGLVNFQKYVHPGFPGVYDEPKS